MLHANALQGRGRGQNARQLTHAPRTLFLIHNTHIAHTAKTDLLFAGYRIVLRHRFRMPRSVPF